MAQILINPEFVLIIISSFTIILLIIIAFCLIKKKKLACSNGSLEKLIKNDDHQKGEFAAPKSRSYYDQFLSKDEVDHFKVSIEWLDAKLKPKICQIPGKILTKTSSEKTGQTIHNMAKWRLANARSRDNNGPKCSFLKFNFFMVKKI